MDAEDTKQNVQKMTRSNELTESKVRNDPEAPVNKDDDNEWRRRMIQQMELECNLDDKKSVPPSHPRNFGAYTDNWIHEEEEKQRKRFERVSDILFQSQKDAIRMSAVEEKIYQKALNKVRRTQLIQNNNTGYYTIEGENTR